MWLLALVLASSAPAPLDSPAALAHLRRCIEDQRPKPCRDAIALGLTPLYAARAWTFLGLALSASRDDPDAPSVHIDAFREAVKIKPDYAFAWYQLGEAELFDPTARIEAYQCALELRPDWVAAREKLADALIADRRPAEAAEAYAAAARARPDNVRAQDNLARVLVGLERWAEALPALQAVSRSSTATIETWTNLGQALERLSLPGALQAFERAVEAPPVRRGEYQSALSQRAWAIAAIERNGGPRAAMAARQRWLDSDPVFRSNALRAEIEHLGFPAGSFLDVCVRLVEDLDRNEHSAEADKRRTSCLTPFREAVAATPDGLAPRLMLAEALGALGRVEEALATARELAKLAPDHNYVTAILASLLRQSGDGAAAVDTLQQAVQRKPDDAALVGTLIRLLEELDRPAEALRWWKHLFERRLPLVELPMREAAFDAREKAAESYRHALEAAPADAVPRCALAFRLNANGRTEEALAAAVSCAAVEPRQAWALAYGGYLLALHGRHEEALRLFAAVEALDPAAFAPPSWLASIRDSAATGVRR